jgi:type VI secretion system secreted protein Hcp
MKEEKMDVILMDMGDDARGERSLPGYEKKIELLSLSHGIAMQITGDMGDPERTAGKPIHQDMTVTKYLDAASPLLNVGCCEGKLFPKVEIILGRTDAGRVVEMMKYTLSNVIISSVSSGGGGGSAPVETLTLNYNKIVWKFTAPGAGESGAVKRSWDLARNTSG